MKEQDRLPLSSLRIMRRLVSAARPFATSAFWGLLCFLSAITIDLIIPVLIRQTIDTHILSGRHKVSAASWEPVRGTAPTGQKGVLLGEHVYVTPRALSGLSPERKDRLTAQGKLDQRSWILFLVRPALLPIVQKYPSLFSSSGGYGMILEEDLARLSLNERLLIRTEDLNNLKTTAFFFLFLFVAYVILRVLSCYILSLFGESVTREIRIKLFGHILHQSSLFLGQTPVGSLVSRTTSDIETLREFFAQVAFPLIGDGLLLIGSVGMLFVLDVRLAFITVLTLPLVLILIFFFGELTKKAHRKVRQATSRLSAFLTEYLGGMETVQLFGQEKRSADRFEMRNVKLLRASLSQLRIHAVFRPLVDLLLAFSLGITLYFGAGLYRTGWTSLGVLIAFVNLLALFYRPIMEIAEKFALLQSAITGGERIFGLLDQDHRIVDQGRTILQRLRGEIRMDKVTFSYRREDPVLKEVSFRILPGQHVAVVGYTGAGKSTLANLLTRLWDIEKGQITLDDIPLKEFPLAWLRQNIRVVDQDIFLFSKSIAENISLGDPSLSRDQIVEAATLARADDFIRALPEGFETILSQRGVNLSKGQRQMIAIARALAHNAPIIILDEATASVDTETEHRIQEGIKTLLEGRTSIIIAHRISTIRQADHILVLSEGRIVEEGNHIFLMKKKGLYSTLYRLQYEKHTEDDSR